MVRIGLAKGMAGPDAPCRETMSAVLLGLVTAVCWGGADFIARFTGRAVGPDVALSGMLVTSAVLLTFLVLATSTPLLESFAGWYLILATGIGVMVATLLLYAALARGPIAMVAPIAGAYPAFNILIGLAAGIVPTGLQWIAILTVMAGVAVVARFAPEPGEDVTGDLRLTLVIALLSALAFALTISAGQAAARLHDELAVTATARWVSVVAAFGYLVMRGRPVVVPAGWRWPVAAQGTLDGLAYVALFAAAHGPGSVIAAVVASSFAAVTVLLARFILKEPMSLAQWVGIAMIVIGVGALSALRT
jgi:drug/metabolite transporter (DMT)-like permease